MPLPQYVWSWLQAFDGEPIDLLYLSGVLLVRLEERKVGEAERSSIFKVLAPIDFGVRPKGGSSWESYFAPRRQRDPSKEGDRDDPDLRSFDAALVDEWVEIAQRSDNPVLKSRFADAVWELGKRLSSNRADLYSYGLLAADSYLRAAESRRYGYLVSFFNGVERAVNLSVQLGNRAIRERAIQLALDYANAAPPEHLGHWMFPFDRIIGLRRLPATDRERILSQFRARFEQSICLRDEYRSTMAGQALANYYHGRRDYEHAKQVTLSYGELTLDLSMTMAAGNATHHIGVVLEAYRRMGLREHLDRVRLLLEKRGKEAQEETRGRWVQFEIDPEPVEKFITGAISVPHPYLALFRLAYGLAPEPEQIAEAIASKSEGVVLHHLIPVSITGDNGLPVSTIDTYEDDKAGRITMEVAREMNLRCGFFLKGAEDWKMKFRLDGINDTPDLYHSPLIAPERIPFFEQGLAAYDAGDYLKAIHLLVPQVENCLRRLLDELGVPTTKSSEKAEGTHEPKNMYDALYDETVRETLDDRLWAFLNTLYVDKNGINLRNLVAHGVAPFDAFNNANAALVVQSVVMLSIYRPEAVQKTTAGVLLSSFVVRRDWNFVGMPLKSR